MEYFDLGNYTRAVTTISDEARTWFDRGLRWTYGYNHEEAVECFRKAIAADPACGMAYWGLTYAIGPNYNKPWDLFEPEEKRPPSPRRTQRSTRHRHCRGCRRSRRR